MCCRSALRRLRFLVWLLPVLLGNTTGVIGQTSPAGEATDENPLLAPFISRAFIDSIVEDLGQLQIEEERVDGVYLDPKTLLLWAAEDNARDIDWRRAATYCKRLVLAGYEDWRLPSLEELETLLRPMAQGAYNLPPRFQLTACCPWSTTLKDEKSAWNFNFQFSKPFSGSFSYTFDHRALCVRTPQEEERLLIEGLQKEARKK